MPPKMEKFLQIAPHSLAIVLGPAEGPAGERSGAAPPAPPAQPRQLSRHHIGYEIFADFKAENMQHFWNRKVTAAVAETFFLGWIDEQVLSPRASGRPADPPRRRGGAGGWPGRRRRWRARRGESAAAPGLVSGTFSAEIGPGERV